jgi:hypothetical protein
VDALWTRAQSPLGQIQIYHDTGKKSTRNAAIKKHFQKKIQKDQ